MQKLDAIAINYIQLFQSGDERGFDHYFKAWYKQLSFFAFRFIKDQAVAEDIVGDSFIKLWKKREKFDTEAGLKSYLYKVVYNGCLREVRSRKSEVRKKSGLAIISDEFETDCLHGMIAAETMHLLYEAISELPAQCRKVFIKLYVEGKSVAETAGEMKITISTVKNQKVRGLKLLKPRFSQ